MTDEERAKYMADLSPEMRAKFERLHELRERANAEEREERIVSAIFMGITGRLVALVPGAKDDPLIVALQEALEPGKKRDDVIAMLVKLTAGGEA